MRSRKDEVEERYETVTDKLYSDREAFGEFLKFSGKFYKTPAIEAMMIFDSNPNAQMVADYDTWRKYGRYVKRNSSSIAVLSEKGEIKHYFDITQTNGKSVPFRWSLNKETAQEYLNMLSAEEQREFKSISSAVDYLSDNAVALRAAAIRSRYDIPEDQAAAFDRSVCTMVRQVVAARCGHDSSFTYKSDPVDFTALDMLHGDRMPERLEFEHLATDIQQTAKSVLLTMEQSINQIIQQRSIEHEHERKNRERNQADMVRGGRDVLPRTQGGERENVQARSEHMDIPGGAVPGSDTRTGGDDERADRQIREGMAEIHGGESPRSDTLTSGQDEMVADPQGDRQRSGGTVSDTGSELRENELTSPDDIQRDRSVGEDEDHDLRTSGDGGHSASVQSINEDDRATYSTNTEMAEEKSPAVSISAFKEYATTQLTFYDTDVREAFIAGDKIKFNALVMDHLDTMIADVVIGNIDIEGCSLDDIRNLYSDMYEDLQVRMDLYIQTYEKIVEGNYIDNLIAAERERTQQRDDHTSKPKL